MFFGEINYIFLYAILPALITVFILSRKKVNKALSIFIKNFNFKKDKNYKRISNLRISSIIFLILAIGFLIFALMQPKWGIIEKKNKNRKLYDNHTFRFVEKHGRKRYLSFKIGKSKT